MEEPMEFLWYDDENDNNALERELDALLSDDDEDDEDEGDGD